MLGSKMTDNRLSSALFTVLEDETVRNAFATKISSSAYLPGEQMKKLDFNTVIFTAVNK